MTVKTKTNPNLHPAISGHGPRPVNGVGHGAGKQMMRRLESMEAELTDSMTYTGSFRWMIPYADLLTVLMGLLFMLVALSNMDNQNLEQQAQTMQAALSHKNQLVAAQHHKLSSLQKKLQALKTLSLTPVELLSDEADETFGQLSGNGIEVSQQERGLVITMMDRVLFESGQANLNTDAKKTLDQLAEILKETPRPIKVEGHTDNTPIKTAQFPSNWELSTTRATNIVKYLITQHGFSPDQLSASGYGEFRPVSSNSSIQGKQKNRRVDIVIMNNEAALFEPQSSGNNKLMEN